MPGTLKHTPAWLSRPSFGFEFFTSSPAKSPPDGAGATGAKRTIVQRGTEIFVAVGNELRWTDLVLLQDSWEADCRPSATQSSSSVDNDRSDDAAYRILKVPISRKIKQLVISPTGDYLAILTSHTTHVAILPDSSHLSADDTSPLKLRTFHVGPTIHVLEQSPIATAIWHPLGVKGSCLITITVDAVIRMWELDSKNIWSFDSPTVAVDLRKLANATTSADDFSPAIYGTSKGFSPDSFDMEVASACIGSAVQTDNLGWVPMTLWIAMRDGDVYALCPFLPSSCVALSLLFPKLSNSISCEYSSIMGLGSDSEHGHAKANDQSMWISDLMAQLNSDRLSTGVPSILQRPERPGVVPMLQGPFQIIPYADEIFDITDISVIVNSSQNSSDSDDEISIKNEEDNPIVLLCIATSEGKVHVCVDLDGVDGCWLPPKPKKLQEGLHSSIHICPELLLIESVTIGELSGSSWPLFSSDPLSSMSLFITHEDGVSHLDLSGWMQKLGDELAEYTEGGLHLRTDLILKDAKALVEHPIRIPAIPRSQDSSSARDISACVALTDSDLGLFVLTSVNGEPRAVTLESSPPDDRLLEKDTNEDFEADDYLMPVHEPRPPYQPSKDFWNDSKITEFVGRHPLNKGPRMTREEIKFSPATLKILMDVHRKLSEETHRLGQAASELFIRCERLQEEFRQQIKEVNNAVHRMDTALGQSGDIYDNDDDGVGTANQIQRRVENVRQRQNTLDNQYTILRGKLGRLNGCPVSDKEDQWMKEIRSMKNSLISRESNDANRNNLRDNVVNLALRVEKLKDVRSQVLQEVHEQGIGARSEDFVVHEEVSAVRSNATHEINTMLERQIALIDATRSKLEKLSLMTV